MFLSTPLSLNFFLLLRVVFVVASENVKSTATTATAAAVTTADLFNLAYPVVAFPVASVCIFFFCSRGCVEWFEGGYADEADIV